MSSVLKRFHVFQARRQSEKVQMIKLIIESFFKKNNQEEFRKESNLLDEESPKGWFGCCTKSSFGVVASKTKWVKPIFWEKENEEQKERGDGEETRRHL